MSHASEESVYNPLDKRNLGESVAEALLENKVVQLNKLSDFSGAGIYALYYTGSFPAYQPIVEKTKDNQFAWPIYIGKAVPKGARKGLLNPKAGSDLCRRLRRHLGSIQAAENLEDEAFFCRYLVVDDIWIPLGESLLIQKFRPVWNVFIDGFGNNDPGQRRHAGERPQWDTLHPGRSWAAKCQPRRETQQDLIQSLQKYWEKLGI